MKRIEEIRASLETFIKAMVVCKNQVHVAVVQKGPEVSFAPIVAQPDMGVCVGKSGANFDALSTLVWAMGLQEPRLKTRLLRFESVPQARPEVDPADLLQEILVALRLGSLQSLRGSDVPALLDKAGNQALELRAYLLGMRQHELNPDVVARLTEGR